VRDEAARLHDIGRALDLIQSAIDGLDQAAFEERFSDGFTAFAASICFALLVIGEACGALAAGGSPRVAAHPTVDWRGWSNLRNVPIHQYFRVRPEMIWRAVTEEIEALRHAVDLRA
jgi:uncharacterized protein with HEPN domain